MLFALKRKTFEEEKMKDKSWFARTRLLVAFLGIALMASGGHAQEPQRRNLPRADLVDQVRGWLYLRHMAVQCSFPKQVTSDLDFIGMIVGMSLPEPTKDELDTAARNAEAAATNDISKSKEVSCAKAQNTVAELSQALGKVFGSGPANSQEAIPHYPQVVGFNRATEALAILKSSPENQVRAEPDGRVRVTQPGSIEWVFVPPNHHAYPAGIRREVVQLADGKSHVEVSVLCDASEQECAKLYREMKRAERSGGWY
jgi:hypothetical protein